MKEFIYFINIILILLITEICYCYAKTNGHVSKKVDKSNLNKHKQLRNLNFLGTNLYLNYDYPKRNCFTINEIGLIAARKECERLVPEEFPQYPIDDNLVQLLIEYFFGANQIIKKITNKSNRIYLQTALFDTLGGYLHYYLIPITKLSFYSGTVSLNTICNLSELFNQCKIYLNTNGNGWTTPIKKPINEFYVEPLYIKFNKNQHQSCINLCLIDEKNANNDDMIVALPKLESTDGKVLSNIWLPFLSKRIFNLRSDLSSFILLRYFITVSKCYNFQGISQDKFNQKFQNWIQQQIIPHLNDEILYPGLGGILRILETLKHPELCRNSKRQSINDDKNIEEIVSPEVKVDNKNLVDKLFGSKVPNDKDQKLLQDNTDFINYDDDCDSDLTNGKYRRNRYIIIAIIVAIIILIFIFIVAVVTKYMSDGCKRKRGTRFHKQKPEGLRILPICKVDSKTSCHSRTSKKSSYVSLKNYCFRSSRSKTKTSPRKSKECSPKTSPRKSKECSPKTSSRKSKECSPLRRESAASRRSSCTTRKTCSCCKNIQEPRTSKVCSLTPGHSAEKRQSGICCISNKQSKTKSKTSPRRPSRQSSCASISCFCCHCNCEKPCNCKKSPSKTKSKHFPPSRQGSCISVHVCSCLCNETPCKCKSSKKKSPSRCHSPILLSPSKDFLQTLSRQCSRISIRRSRDNSPCRSGCDLCTTNHPSTCQKSPKKRLRSPIKALQTKLGWNKNCPPGKHPIVTDQCSFGPIHLRGGAETEVIQLQTTKNNIYSSENSLTSIKNVKQQTIKTNKNDVYKTTFNQPKQTETSSSESITSLKKIPTKPLMYKRNPIQTSNTNLENEKTFLVKQKFRLVNERIKPTATKFSISKKHKPETKPEIKMEISRIPIKDKKLSSLPTASQNFSISKKHISEKKKDEFILPKTTTKRKENESSWETLNDSVT